MRPLQTLAIAGVIASASFAGYVAIQSASAQESADLEIADDGRQILYLTPEQRDHVRTEMRGFLFGVQSLTVALADEDREEIARLAADLGPKGMMGQGMGKGMGHGSGGGHGPGMGQGMQHKPGSGQGMGKGMGGGQHGMMANMPDEFFNYARPLRQGFMQISEMAADAPFTEIQRAFGENLENCVACHGTFTARDAK